MPVGFVRAVWLWGHTFEAFLFLGMSFCFVGGLLGWWHSMVVQLSLGCGPC